MLNNKISAMHKNIISQIFRHILTGTAIKSEDKNQKKILKHFIKNPL